MPGFRDGALPTRASFLRSNHLEQRRRRVIRFTMLWPTTFSINRRIAERCTDRDRRLTVRYGICLILIALSISGCVNSTVVGVSKNYRELLQGKVTVNPITGRAYVELKSLVSNVRCAGPATVAYIQQVETGGAVLVCDDGRVINVSVARSDVGRSGVGKDQYGNQFIFEFGMSDEEAARRLDNYSKQVAQTLGTPVAK